MGSSSQAPWLNLWALNPRAQWDQATECWSGPAAWEVGGCGLGTEGQGTWKLPRAAGDASRVSTATSFPRPPFSLPGTCRLKPRSAPTFHRAQTHGPATGMPMPRLPTAICRLCFVLHLLRFPSPHINAHAWVRGGRGGGGRGGILTSWVTAVALGFLVQPRQRAGGGAVSFYVGRKGGRFSIARPSLTADGGFCVWRLRDLDALAFFPRELAQK